MTFSERIRYVTNILRQRKLQMIACCAALLYIALNALVLLYVHGSIGSFYSGMYARYTLPFSIATLIIATLVGIDIALLVEKIHELHYKSAGLSITGLLFGSLAAGCPGCFFGLFPLVLSLFGITGTLAVMPLNGLEFQLLAIVLLSCSIFFLAKETEVTCKIRNKRKKE